MTQPTLITLATLPNTNTHPFGVLVADAAGNLFGTTGLSPTSDNSANTAAGTIFELVKGATTTTTLATFTGADGADPVAGLTIDAAGNLYGATAYGGASGRGTLFELAKGATAVTTLATFDNTNGAVPQSLLTADAAGDLFGVTNEGGSAGVGTVFELVKGATAVTTLGTFTGPNGAYGEGGVVFDAAGDIFGTTVYGGAGQGNIFELVNGAATVTNLASFNGADGATIRSGLVSDAAGNLYGTTFGGGANTDGTVYELAKGATTVTTLATFNGQNGAGPVGTLLIDADGNLYGTTQNGGGANDGTVFKLNKGASVVTTLATFDAATGSLPYAGLTLDAAGNLFGTTTSGNGTVFELPVATAAVPLDVVTTSPDTAALLATINVAISALPPADVVTGNGGAPPASPAPGSALLLPASTTGAVAIPTGYRYVELASGSNVDLTGGDTNTMIIGDAFTYSGNALDVGSGAGVSQITDNAAAATILIGSSGSATVTAGGAGATVLVGDDGTSMANLSGLGATFGTGSNSHFTLSATGNSEAVNIGNGALGKVTVSGTGDTVAVGGSNVAAAGTAPASGLTSIIQATAGSANTFNITDTDSRTVLSLGTSDTVNASAGVSSIFGLSGDVVGTGSAQVLFVGGQGVSTIVGGAANAVVFATSGQVFDLGNAQGNVFVGGTAASTINAGAGGGSFFGGAHGDSYNFGTSAAQVFVGGGGADTLSGAAGTVAPEIFATGAEAMTITAATPPVTVVAFASEGFVDASATAGNNNFFAGYGFSGNQTLVGSATGMDSTGAATYDVFVAGANPSGTATSLTIQDWHAGDVFYLTGFTAADTGTMDTAIGNSLANGGAGNLSFTLSDNTTITFLNNHPTNFDGPSNAAF